MATNQIGVSIPDDEQGIQPIFTPGQEPQSDTITNPVAEGSAKILADQYHWGMGEASPGRDNIYDALVSGNESRLRMEQANTEEMRNIQGPQQAAQNFLDAKGSEPINQQEIKYLYDLGEMTKFPDNVDTSKFFEQKYADQVLRTATAYNPDTVDEGKPWIARSAFDAMQGHKFIESDTPPTPDERDGMLINHDLVTRKMLYNRIAQDVIDRYQKESWGTTIYYRGLQTIPGYTWWHTQDLLSPGPLGLAGNMRQQIDDLYDPSKNDVATGALTLKGKLDELYASNPAMANDIAQKVLSYSDSDQAFDAVFNAIDLYVGGDVGRGLAKMAFKSATTTATIPGILDLTGNTADAALREVIDKSRTNALKQGKSAQQSLDNLMGVTQTLTNPNSVLKDAANTRFSPGEVSNFADMLKNYGTGLIKSVLLDPVNVTRVPPGSEAYKAILETAQDTASRIYNRTNQNIMSVEPLRSVDDAITNLDQIAVNIGGPNAEPFVTTYQAKQAARRYGLNEYEVVPHGVYDPVNGNSEYAIRLRIPVDETLLSVAQALQKHVAAETTPDRIQSATVNFFRERGKFLATDVNRNVKIAAGGTSKLTSLSRNILSREFGNMKKGLRQDVSDFLTHQQDNEVWSDTIGNFEHDWYKFHGTYPSIDQAKAYFALRDVNDAEYLMNNIRATTVKGREGFMSHRFVLKGTKEADMPWIEGRSLAQIPWSSTDDFATLVWPNQKGTTFTRFRSVFSTQAERKSIDDLVKNDGYRILNLSKYGMEDLAKWAADQGIKDFPAGRIDYVVLKDFKSKPLDFNNIPYKNGGHWRYRDPFFVGQPHVVSSKFPGGKISNDYLGDKNWFSARTEAEAKEMAKHAETARNLAFDQNNVQAARAYVAQHMPMSWKEFRNAFNPKFGNLDPKQKIYWRASNATIEDQHKISNGYRNFSDYGKSEHNPLSDNVLFRYGQEKGARLSGIYNVGTEEHPVWQMQPSRLLDPYNAVRRASNSVMASRYTDDLKVGAAARYITEFKEVLNKPYNELQKFPVRALVDADLINKAHPDKELVAKAYNYRRAVMEFLQENPVDVTKGNWVKEQVLAHISGFSRQETAISWLDRLTTSDPKAFLRYWAGFVPNMGLWNPKQLWMQAQGMGVAASVEGWDVAAKAAGAGWFMRGALLNGHPDVLDAMTRQALKYWGWKPRHFQEALDGLYKTDFWRVGDNWADVNDIRSASSISTARTAAEHSMFFFNAGERTNKITAWNASYMKWRKANPFAKFDNAGMKEVLDYADFLTLNMTRASSAANQANATGLKGWAAVATQFWSYQTRLMDAFFDKQLSASQKLKFLTWQSVLYGVPIGTLGVTAGAFIQPSQMFRKFADYEGWDLSNPLVQAVVNGIPQTLINVATGADQNIAQTMGPGGNSILGDIIGSSKVAPDWLKNVTGSWGREDKSDFLTIALGASGTNLKKALDASSPLAGWLLNHMIPGAGKPYSVEDFANILKIPTVGNNAVRAWWALNLQNYYGKNGQQILPDHSLNGFDAAMEFVFGTIPQKAADWYGDIENDKYRQQAQSIAKDQAVQAYRRAIDPNISSEDAMKEIENAQKWIEVGGFSVVQRPNILREAFGTRQSEVEQLERKINLGTHENFMRWLDKADEGKTQ